MTTNVGRRHTPAGYARTVEWELTGSGLPNVVRKPGSAQLFIPGWAIRVSGPRAMPHNMTMNRALDTITPAVGAPAWIRMVGDEPGDALVHVRLRHMIGLWGGQA